MLIDLLGDITQEGRGRIVLEQEGGRCVKGANGLSAWWLPLSDAVGLKILHSLRFQANERRVPLGFKNLEEAQRIQDVVVARLACLRQDFPGVARYLPDIYGALLVRHTGIAQMRRLKRAKLIRRDDALIYPAWFVRTHRLVQKRLPRKVRQRLCGEIAETGFLLTHRFWGRASNFGLDGDRPILLDIEDVGGIKFF